MKKRLLRAGVLGLWAFFSGQLSAAPSAELKVSGKIKHSGCSVIASNDGVYDYGSVPVNAADGQAQMLPSLKQTWQVRCESEAYLAIIPTDNRAASRSTQDLRRFGLSNAADGRPIGYFLLGVARPTVNGAPAALHSRNALTSQNREVALISGERTDWLSADTTRAAGRTYTMDISVTPFLATNIPVTDKVELDGSVTLNFVFGL
ncbi:hypothetical protein SME22J_32320 [Serratia marcescens]|nr:hypothetical protein SME22J_32320 [Serratia marcescens]